MIRETKQTGIRIILNVVSCFQGFKPPVLCACRIRIEKDECIKGRVHKTGAITGVLLKMQEDVERISFVENAFVRTFSRHKTVF